MDIYILRHGEAEPRGPAVAEADRKLTPRGSQDVRRVIKLARAAKLRPDAILSSRYTRAIQTAEIAAKLLGVTAIQESRSLLPSAKPAALWKELAKLNSPKPILLVGHEPHLSAFLAFLTKANTTEIKKGALLRVQVNQPPAEPEGILKWLLPPSLAR